MQPDVPEQPEAPGEPAQAGATPSDGAALGGSDGAFEAEEVTLMNAVATEVVGSFDFDAARRFIESRSRQVRREIRVYALSMGVLVAAGVAQHVLRKPGAFWSLDRTDGLMLAVLGMLAIGAGWRARVLLSVGVGRAPVSGEHAVSVADREAVRVRRERVVGGALTILAAVGLGVAGVDAALDGAWVFSGAFGVCGVLCMLTARRFIGGRSIARTEQYIQGRIDDVAFVRGEDPTSRP